jgi:SHS2 domain-containing protein
MPGKPCQKLKKMTATGEALFQEISHTADIGIQIQAATLEGLFEKAGLSLYALMVSQVGIVETEERVVEASGETPEELLLEWLCALLKLFNVYDFVGKSIRVLRMEPRVIRAQVRGDKFNPERHEFYTEIKGVTYHGLSIEYDAAGWRAQVIFDV